MSDTTLSRYVSRTLAYLDSDEGRAAWDRNEHRNGASYLYNMAAAVMTACHIIRYETITAVVEAVETRRVAA